MTWRVRAERLRALPLPQVLAALEALPDPRDPAKWRTARGLLSVNGTRFINWHMGTGGGGAIDLVMHVQQRGFGQALDWLEERFGSACPHPSDSTPPPRTWVLPPPVAHQWSRVHTYLTHERKLPPTLLTPLVQAGRLYADARANAVFLLGESVAGAVGAELRGTTPGVSWRGMAPGSRKDRGFFAVGAGTAAAVVLCESAIDALSCHLLHPNYRCLSTSGARPNPAWLGALLGAGRPVLCGFDRDPTGEAMARRLIALHPSVTRLLPPAKDWNDALAHRTA